jgi:hypothetical protein
MEVSCFCLGRGFIFPFVIQKLCAGRVWGPRWSLPPLLNHSCSWKALEAKWCTSCSGRWLVVEGKVLWCFRNPSCWSSFQHVLDRVNHPAPTSTSVWVVVFVLPLFRMAKFLMLSGWTTLTLLSLMILDKVIFGGSVWKLLYSCHTQPPYCRIPLLI